MSESQEKKISIEVNGVELSARPGQMLIEVTDEADIYIPRFCYHPKLSIAANCRMCLVDVEKAPKPLPACATPVTDGMKVFTRSPRAISAQKATMEFLLINHPLDCPICDQGGECELQDLAMGYGRGVSRYTEGKRVVKDKNLGPLVSTDMTRCIHCTRCVRFGQEIAGIQELGTIGRTEDMEIGTFVEKSVDHEMSGNIIDLCPVGALNNKPYRYSARAWEMVAQPMVAPHDCAGSNLWGHVLRGRLRRVVPRDNEAINETWLSDRDRFSCFGVDVPDRLRTPMIKRDDEWHEASWSEALTAVRTMLQADGGQGSDGPGVLASPSSTVEELYLLRRIADRLQTRNIDYRLRRRDFADQDADPLWPALGCEIADLERQQGIVLVGSNIRNEVPIIAHRLRKAVRQGGASVAFVNLQAYPVNFPVAGFARASADTFASTLAHVVAAAAERVKAGVPAHVRAGLKGVKPNDDHRSVAGVLAGQERGLVLLGHIAQRHPAFSAIRSLAAALCELTGARLGYLSEGGNAAGAAVAGCLPHRDPGGIESAVSGLDVLGMLRAPRKSYLLFGIEPGEDLAEPALALEAFRSADHVISLTAYVTDQMLDCADVLLPVGTFAETDGTYVNCEGRWQSARAAAKPIGDSRPGWRVLRVLGNELGMSSCDYRSADDVLSELRARLGDVASPDGYAGRFTPDIAPVSADEGGIDLNIYSVDPVVRRSTPLQDTSAAKHWSHTDEEAERA